MAGKEKKEYSEQESREHMTEVKTGRRVFDTEKYGLVQIRFPKVEENRLADWEYSKVLAQALKDGIDSNKQMEKFIRENGIWTEEDDKEVEKLKKEIDKQITVLGKMDEGSKNAKKVEEKIEDLRQEIIDKQQERQKFFNHTAESKADEAKMSFLVYKCSELADTGKPLWDSYEDFKNEEDQATVNEIVYQFITFINGLPADFLSRPSASEEEDVVEEEQEATESE